MLEITTTAGRERLLLGSPRREDRSDIIDIGFENSSDEDCIVVGFHNNTEAKGITVGTGCNANGEANIAIGTDSGTDGDYSMAIGNDCHAAGLSALAIGRCNAAAAKKSAVIGGEYNRNEAAGAALLGSSFGTGSVDQSLITSTNCSWGKVQGESAILNRTGKNIIRLFKIVENSFYSLKIQAIMKTEGEDPLFKEKLYNISNEKYYRAPVAAGDFIIYHSPVDGEEYVLLEVAEGYLISLTAVVTRLTLV